MPITDESIYPFMFCTIQQRYFTAIIFGVLISIEPNS